MSIRTLNESPAHELRRGVPHSVIAGDDDLAMERSANRSRTAVAYDADRLSGLVQPLTGDHTDFDAAIARARDKTYVLIGEATHGTHEFYRIRAEITKRLIREHGFSAVAIEGD